MTIQGIIAGFADPQDTTHHVVVVGRGPRYIMVVNGVAQDDPLQDLDAAYTLLKRAMRGLGRSHWLQVTEVETSSLGATRVTQLGTSTFEASHPDAGQDRLNATSLAKTAMKAAIAGRQAPRR